MDVYMQIYSSEILIIQYILHIYYNFIIFMFLTVVILANIWIQRMC